MDLKTKSGLQELADNEVQRDLARIYAMIGRVKDARQLWQDQVSRRPDSFEAHLELGKLLARSGERRSALREYRLLRQIMNRQFVVEGMPGGRSADASTRRCITRAFEQHREEVADQMAELRKMISR